jgi:hypothetical protein
LRKTIFEEGKEKILEVSFAILKTIKSPKHRTEKCVWG